MIYLIWAKDTCKIKIGYTAGNAKDRLSALQTGSPTKLLLIGVIPGSLQDEQEIHRKLKKFESYGEWFDFAYVLKQKEQPCVDAVLSFLGGELEEDNWFEFLEYWENAIISMLWHSNGHHKEKEAGEKTIRREFSSLKIKSARMLGFKDGGNKCVASYIQGFEKGSGLHLSTTADFLERHLGVN